LLARGEKQEEEGRMLTRSRVRRKAPVMFKFSKDTGIEIRTAIETARTEMMSFRHPVVSRFVRLYEFYRLQNKTIPVITVRDYSKPLKKDLRFVQETIDSFAQTDADACVINNNMYLKKDAKVDVILHEMFHIFRGFVDPKVRDALNRHNWFSSQLAVEEEIWAYAFQCLVMVEKLDCDWIREQLSSDYDELTKLDITKLTDEYLVQCADNMTKWVRSLKLDIL